MKNLISIILSTVFLLTSCTEVIDINTNAVDPQIVVEGNIDTDGKAWVYITKTDNLNGNNVFPLVSDAMVKISDSDGNTEILSEVSPGTYVSNNPYFVGRVGKTYYLSVQTEDKNITSASTIPTFVKIDSLSVLNSIFPGGGPPVGNQPAPFYEITVHYSDPDSIANYYRMTLFINGVPQSGNRVSNDKFNNGKQVKQALIMYNEKLTSGDTISLEMQCIEKNVYEYFNSMGNSAMGPRNASSPANPYTNLTGAILGYFSAHTVEKKEYIIP